MKHLRLAAVPLAVILISGSARPNWIMAQMQSDQPAVVSAVAPFVFIPWIFGEIGISQVVVEVTVNTAGEVTSAKSVEGSNDFPWGDHSFEQTAMRWRFAPAEDGARERRLKITFILRIMPKGAQEDELAPIYTAPYQMEIRHRVYNPPVNANPNPEPTDNKPRSGSKKRRL